jgi:uncharacterized membrane protein
LVDLPRRAFIGAMLAGSALIAATSLVYFDVHSLPPFAIEKFPLKFEGLWLAMLRVHVASALLALPLCLVLLTRYLQRRPTWHRALGRVAGIAVLGFVVPSGVVLAFTAKGGALVTVGFLLSAAIVAWGVARGVSAARSRELAAHARAMRHVVAQMSVAVTSRVLIVALDFATIAPDVAYVVALWGPVLASAALAELVSSKTDFLSSQLVYAERIRREITELAPVVRARAVIRPVDRAGR